MSEQHRQVLCRKQEISFYSLHFLDVRFGYLANVIKKKGYFYIRCFLTASLLLLDYLESDSIILPHKNFMFPL